jgi:hypothetical protein
VHHVADVVVVVDGDGVVDEEVLAVGAEVAAGDVAEQDGVPGPGAGPDDLPHDGLHLRLVVVALHDAEAAVGERRPPGRGGEVGAVGGAVEEQVHAEVVVVDVHRPRRVERGAAALEGDAHPVVVGVEVVAGPAAPQPHVVPVVPQLHRHRWPERGG